MENLMDIFGDTDPKKMPEHFFFDALFINYKVVIPATIEKQDFTVAPRHWYIDAVFKCRKCKDNFTWTAKEQQVWFEEYKLNVDAQPGNCLNCRIKWRELLELRKEYDANVATAREQGTVEQKRRIIELISEFEKELRKVPDKMLETKKSFERQTKKDKSDE